MGSLKGPQFAPGLNENTEMGTYCTIYNGTVYNAEPPTVTNTTACKDGFLNDWKNWCSNHAVDCVQNFTIGDFPEMILSAHQQYLAGSKAATGNSMCPIGENAAFCAGWDNNNDDYGGQDCGDAYQNYTGPITNLAGCPLDVMKPSQIAALPMLACEF
ncbi:MAG: hypothetical protein WAM14_11915 [Candidatus Nitrosopolaris sp.]